MNGRLVRVDRAQRHVALHVAQGREAREPDRSIVLTDHVEGLARQRGRRGLRRPRGQGVLRDGDGAAGIHKQEDEPRAARRQYFEQDLGLLLFY